MVKESALNHALLALYQRFNHSEIPLESQHDCYFRLSVLPEHLYFSESLFSGSIASGYFSLKRAEFHTALGGVCADEKSGRISKSLADNLLALDNGLLKVDADSVKDNCRKSIKIDKAMGLKSLLAGSGTRLKLCCVLEAQPLI